MIEVSDDIKFQALHEHYRDTFSNIKGSIVLRDKLTLLVFLVLGILVLYTFWPADTLTTFSQITMREFGIAVPIGAEFLGSIIWLALLFTIIRYAQTVVYIERQYVYIHRIEKELSEHYDKGISFTREGESYLKKYPKFSNWVWALYMIVFPFVLAIIVLAKIVSELVISFPRFSLLAVLNTAIATCVLISIILYVLFMHRQK